MKGGWGASKGEVYQLGVIFAETYMTLLTANMFAIILSERNNSPVSPS